MARSCQTEHGDQRRLPGNFHFPKLSKTVRALLSHMQHRTSPLPSSSNRAYQPLIDGGKDIFNPSEAGACVEVCGDAMAVCPWKNWLGDSREASLQNHLSWVPIMRVRNILEAWVVLLPPSAACDIFINVDGASFLVTLAVMVACGFFHLASASNVVAWCRAPASSGPDFGLQPSNVQTRKRRISHGV